MQTDDLIAIGIHTLVEVSCWNPFDSDGEESDRAADKCKNRAEPLILRQNALRLLGLAPPA